MSCHISKCCKNFKNDFHKQKPFFSESQEHKKHFPEDKFAKKLFLQKPKFFEGGILHSQIDQNAISGKSAKNALTSQKQNFFENGRTRLVYDSF